MTIKPALSLLALPLAIVILQSQTNPDPQLSATYTNGTLRANIPYNAPQAATGHLTVEILDPEDRVIASTHQQATIAQGKGQWQPKLTLAKPIPNEDLVWHRLHYLFKYQGHAIENTAAIAQILSTPVLHILSDQAYLTNGPAAIRVIATDSKNNPIAGASAVRIDLAPPNQKPRTLFQGPLNSRGTTEAQFHFPANLTGTFPLHYVVDTPIGETDFTQQVRLEDKISLLLTTEKPIYQPGQTIHVRALALDRANHQASANRNLIFELEDPRGNKVFKKSTQTDPFGIASAEFTLADEVNLGAYHLRAITDKTTEIAINVQRYVLPKFKVQIDFTGASKHGYRPGDHVTGTVRANYFFGKPVDHAEVTLKGTGMDVAQFEINPTKGQTDAEGAWHFESPLPKYFAGKPLTQGAARVLIEATVKDSASHEETRGEPITVSEQPILITAVPEGGTLAPNLQNQLFILTSYPDGTPAITDLRIRPDGDPEQNITTDEGGIAVVKIDAPNHAETIKIDAKSKEGDHASATTHLTVRRGSDQILLRTEHAVYKAGDRMQLHLFSTKETGTVYVDIIKDGQTVLTRDLDITHGQAELTLTATPDLAGTLDVNAYLFGVNAIPISDHRLVFVQPAGELKIDATSDSRVYKPGDEARVQFRVTNTKGEGVQAALGLQVVDEAVFALAEKQPGFAKVFFYLEQEAMKPRYEIHSIGMPQIVGPEPLTKLDQRDRAARALFSATEMVNNNKFTTEVGRRISTAKYADYTRRYQQHLIARLNQTQAIAKSTTIQDAWGTDIKLDKVSWNSRMYMLRSAGPDKKFNTVDDLTTYVEVRTHRVTSPPTAGTIDLQIEHDRGPFNGRAEISGTIEDQTGEGIVNASITARELATGATRTAQTNAAGDFALSALPEGDYEIRVLSAGFQTASRKLTLKARDRAILSSVLTVGEMGEKVEATDVGFAGRRGGAPMALGGVLSGVIPGLPAARPGAPAPAMMARAMEAMDMSATGNFKPVNTLTIDKKAEPAEAAPRVRSYFPEALYINPEIITDHNGLATVTIPMADSITTWRMAMTASTTHGALGSGTTSLKVFQDFFVDLDLPVTLTQGDRVSIPVAAYNYSRAKGDVNLKLQQDNWFNLVSDVPDKTVAVEAGRVGGSQFTIEAKRIGKFKLTLTANMKTTGRADIVVREIEVIPNGREQTQVFNGRLETSALHQVNFPATAVPDASNILVRLYPGPLSQVVEGMDAILRMPGGCFEQTSSSTYPNVLALDYMKKANKLTPEVHAKAEGYIANGYQRLLTFEVPGGGFSWFGQAPANKILTSYGLMEFSDMSKVHDVDPKLIQRTQEWLASQQQPDGSWKPDANFINEGATNRYNSDLLRITAYIGWSLGNTGYQGPAVEKARNYVEQHMDAKADPYTLAVIANFAADSKDRNFTRKAIQLLLDARTEQDDKVWWTAEETNVYARGASAAVETTGLAVQSLLKAGESSAVASKALSYLASKKDANGTWGTTQATIMALRALLLSTEKGAADVRGTLEVTINGKPVEHLVLTPDNNDLLHEFVLKGIDAKTNNVAIRFNGKGGLAYQIVGRYFIPWDQKPAKEPLSIDVAYDRTHLQQDDIATATATVKNNLNKSANMVMIDLGIPPGFDLLSEDLQSFQEKTVGQKGGRLEKFSLTATQAILYFDSIAPESSIKLNFRLRAKYPIRAKTLQSRVYEYYEPEVNSTARPVQLEVAKR